jgi:hypothetical protein
VAAERTGPAIPKRREQGMASLILAITLANVYNRLNRVTRQVAGAW